MEQNKKPLHLFEGYGVEMEYMIVKSDDLSVNPIADKLLKEVTGNYETDYENEKIAWSNELVAHVIELKTNGPTKTLVGLDLLFANNINKINIILKSLNSKLLPTAVHPLMNPMTETVIWPHEYNAVYSLYDSIFGCKGHGWSNLQSTHINLPFANDEEFAKLHAAIRLVLPLIPALSASSPIIEGKVTGFYDTRLEYYRKNQQKIPTIAGKVIPEQVFSESEYYKDIFEPIRRDIAPYDKESVLEHHFLNSRGAIARFDRKAIEIRIVDIQECPSADLAIVELIVELLKDLVSEKFVTLEKQKKWHEDDLSEIFLQTIRTGETTVISNSTYLNCLGVDENRQTASEVWKKIRKRYELVYANQIDIILTNGTLSTRILKALGKAPSNLEIRTVYEKLSNCLLENKQFVC